LWPCCVSDHGKSIDPMNIQPPAIALADGQARCRVSWSCATVASRCGSQGPGSSGPSVLARVRRQSPVRWRSMSRQWLELARAKDQFTRKPHAEPFSAHKSLIGRASSSSWDEFDSHHPLQFPPTLANNSQDGSCPRATGTARLCWAGLAAASHVIVIPGCQGLHCFEPRRWRAGSTVGQLFGVVAQSVDDQRKGG
jgi:hypothetical protein